MLRRLIFSTPKTLAPLANPLSSTKSSVQLRPSDRLNLNKSPLRLIHTSSIMSAEQATKPAEAAPAAPAPAAAAPAEGAAADAAPAEGEKPSKKGGEL